MFCVTWTGIIGFEHEAVRDKHECLLQAVKGTGALYLEAPVSGSKQPAEKGQLIFLCGGDKELYEQATPLLKVMGKAQFFLGEVRRA